MASLIDIAWRYTYLKLLVVHPLDWGNYFLSEMYMIKRRTLRGHQHWCANTVIHLLFQGILASERLRKPLHSISLQVPQNIIKILLQFIVNDILIPFHVAEADRRCHWKRAGLELSHRCIYFSGGSICFSGSSAIPVPTVSCINISSFLFPHNGPSTRIPKVHHHSRDK